MRAAVLYGPGDVRVEERSIPRPEADEVLIRVHACGVCGTDDALNRGEYPGNYPVVIGHEFSGVVAEVGSAVTRFRPGDRVTADPNRVCRSCYFCRSGQEHLCDNLQSMGVHIDGADAEYCLMQECNVYSIGPKLSFEDAAFTEPLACAIHGTDLARVAVGDTVLIIGAGGMGNLITQCVKNSGAANIIVSEPIAERRTRALANGATHAFDPRECDLKDEVRKIKSVGADIVIEVAGNPGAQTSCPDLTRKGGTIVFFGVSPKESLIEINPFLINENEQRILGSFNNKASTARAVEMLSLGRIRVDNLVSHRFRLAEYPEVFRHFGGRETMKLMVRMEP